MFLAEGTEAFRVAVCGLSGEAEPGQRQAGACAETQLPRKGLEPGRALRSRVASVHFL